MQNRTYSGKTAWRHMYFRPYPPAYPHIIQGWGPVIIKIKVKAEIFLVLISTDPPFAGLNSPALLLICTVRIIIIAGLPMYHISMSRLTVFMLEQVIRNRRLHSIILNVLLNSTDCISSPLTSFSPQCVTAFLILNERNPYL